MFAILVRTCFVTKLERAMKFRQPPETTDMPVCGTLKLFRLLLRFQMTVFNEYSHL